MICMRRQALFDGRFGASLPASARQNAFTLIETLIAVLVAATMLTALYASFTAGWATVKLAREDLRATQILLQRMETLRLCTFTNIPTATATEYYDPTDQAAGGGGTAYTVTLTTNMPTAAELRGPPIYYLTNMVKITAT